VVSLSLTQRIEVGVNKRLLARSVLQNGVYGARPRGEAEVGVLRGVDRGAGAAPTGRGWVTNDADLGAELAVVGLEELDAGDLGDGIGFVGGLERAGEEGLLAHGLLGQPRVDIGAAEAPGLG